MTVQHHPPPHRALSAGWFARLIARADIQRLASRLPVVRRIARRDGAELFEILQGFVASQVLYALVELGILRSLLEGPESVSGLAIRAGISPDRMAQLLRAGVALRLLRRGSRGRYALSRRGAALLGVPGLEAMIRHNRAFYADMADPVALLRGGGETELQRFWPYVQGAAGEVSEDVAARYSELMALSQVLVAQDSLRMIDMTGVARLLDVGGGAGVFLSHVLRACPQARADLFDLPEVLPAAEAHLAQEGLTARVTLYPGSFRSEPLPRGADAVSLVRVLYDHDDDTVSALLTKVHDALPPGGRLFVSEPMAGGDRPERSGDIYYAFYTMAMGAGKTRSASEIAGLCRAAGFEGIRIPRAPRPYITSALTCVKRA